MKMVAIFVTGALCGAALLAGGGALLSDGLVNASEETDVVDGKLWLQSTQAEKRAYLVGVGNMIAVEKLYQDGAKTPLTENQSTIRRFWDGIDKVTLEGSEATLDKWYEANPKKQGEPVLVVIWRQIVEPRLKELGKK